MKKYKIITIAILYILIWNIVFPCFSNATTVSTIEQIKIKYEQALITEGEAQREKIKAQFPDFDEKETNSMIASYLQQKKEDIIKEIAETIADETLKKEFLEQANSLGTTYVNAKYGNVTTQDDYFNAFSVVLDGVGGILTYLLKLKWVFLPASILELLGTGLASIGTENIDDPKENIYFLTLDSIFFNKVTLTDINIFDFNKAGPSNITQNNPVYKIRQNIAQWYYAIRNFAIIFGLLALIYIGVKMAISSVAEDRAKYKKMLVDWLVSIILVFTLHYVIVIVVNINNSIVGILDESRKIVQEELAQEQVWTQDIGSLIGDIVIPEKTLQGKLAEEALSISFVKGWGAGILYILLMAMTFIFLIVYIKRMATIAFLTIIAPLITITYSIDKSRKWKSRSIKYLVKRVFSQCINSTISLYYLFVVYTKCYVFFIYCYRNI